MMPEREVAGVGDARVGEHALEVALRQREHVPDDHREDREDDHDVAPVGPVGAGGHEKSLAKPTKAAALTPMAMKAVTGVGAPS